MLLVHTLIYNLLLWGARQCIQVSIGEQWYDDGRRRNDNSCWWAGGTTLLERVQ